MREDFDKAQKIIDDLIENIPEEIKDDQLELFTYIYVKVANMLEYDDHACELIDAHLGGLGRERAYEFVVEPASDIRCLVRGEAICKGYAEVLKVILNKLGIETIKVSGEGHEWNQVLINGTWYNCDLTNDSDYIKNDERCQYFLKSDSDIPRKPTSKSHKCEISLSTSDQINLKNKIKPIITRENYDKALNEIKEKIKGKISTDDLLVACRVFKNTTLIEPFSQYESLGLEFHEIIIDPKRSLVIKNKFGNGDLCLDVATMERIFDIDYEHSYYSHSSPGGTLYYAYIGGIFNSGISSLNDSFISQRKRQRLGEKAYLMTFREYIKKKLGINIDELTILQANALLKLTNIIRPRRFVLSEDETVAQEQLDKKVYMKKTKKEN